MENIKQYVSMIKENKSLLDKDGKISSDDLSKCLMFVNDSEIREKIIVTLTEDGIVKIRKGRTSYSPIMVFLYDLITEGKLQKELSKNGKFLVTLPDNLKDAINENENGVFTFFNNLNQEIKLNCNFDNLEVKKAKLRLEKKNAEVEKSFKSKN